MRKRSKYRPRPVLANPVGYVLESISPVTAHSDHILDLKIKNHGAMQALTRGEAKRSDIDLLVAMVNMTEALWRLGFGKEYKQELMDGLDALHAVGTRGSKSGEFILKASEMNAINTVMDLHDAQMDVITIRDLERGLEIVMQEHKHKRMRHMKEMV